MPFQKPEAQSQEQFDHLLAKGMKILFNPEISPKLIEAVTKTENPVAGIKAGTEAIVDKLRQGLEKVKKNIPRDMLPELNLALASQLAELVSDKTGDEIPEDVVAEAMGYMAEEGFSEAIQKKSRTPEEVAGIANEYASLAKELGGSSEVQEESDESIS